MKPMSDLVPNTLPIKSIGLLMTPIDWRIEFTGPLFENSVKNTLVNAILISIQNLPYTIAMLIISLLPIGSLLLFPNYWGQIIFFNTAISYGMVAYLNSIFLNKILNKYIN